MKLTKNNFNALRLRKLHVQTISGMKVVSSEQNGVAVTEQTCIRFESKPSYRLFWPQFHVVFLSSSKRILVWRMKVTSLCLT